MLDHLINEKLKYMYEEKFKEVKYDDVVDKYGYVVNLDLAKYLIYLIYCNDKDSYIQNWVNKCQNSLEQVDECEFYLRDPNTNLLSIGGPGGYSGYMFQEFNKYCEDEFPEDEPEHWGIGMEEEINSYPLVFVIIENKPRLFILRETD